MISDSKLREIVRDQILSEEKYQPRDEKEISSKVAKASKKVSKSTSLMSNLKKYGSVSIPIFAGHEVVFKSDKLSQGKLEFKIPNVVTKVGTPENPILKNISLTGTVSNIAGKTPEVAIKLAGKF